MGIRVALVGRTRPTILIHDPAGRPTLAAAGVALGAWGAALQARWLGSCSTELARYDPLSYGLALLLLPAAALLGCWRPAWRAAAASPAEVIREE